MSIANHFSTALPPKLFIFNKGCCEQNPNSNKKKSEKHPLNLTFSFSEKRTRERFKRHDDKMN